MAKTSPVIGFYGPAYVETFHRVISGVLRYLDEDGAMQAHDFRTAEMFVNETQIKPPWQGRCDGLVIGIGRPDEASSAQLADWVLSGGVPVVNIAADWDDPRIASFSLNQQALGRLAASHLVDCGCKSFLYVGFAGSAGSPQRGKAFRAALVKRGRKVAEHACRHRMIGALEDEREVRRETELTAKVRDLPKPLGVWALNDNFASAVYILCEQLGLDIPQQVKVLGVDDLAVARMLKPALSSIRTPREELGYRAMKTLHRLLEGKRMARRQTEIGGASLVVRESTFSQTSKTSDVKAIREFIASHACSGLTVEQIAATMDISRRSLERQFRDLFGHSPGQEINLVRLHRAKELLRQQKLSVSRIASMVGFEETAALSKFFSKQTGLSPSEYRETLE